jgi:hypothetical protein
MKTSGTEDPQVNPHSYSQLIFDKGTQNNGEKTVSSTNVTGKSRYLHVDGSNYIHVFHPVKIPTQSGLRDLIVRTEALKKEQGISYN